MKKTKMEKGITLVALIITIVVLLILAAVAIAAIQNENILSHANNAAVKYNGSVTSEQGILGGYLDVLDKYNGNEWITIYEGNATTESGQATLGETDLFSYPGRYRITVKSDEYEETVETFSILATSQGGTNQYILFVIANGEAIGLTSMTDAQEKLGAIGPETDLTAVIGMASTGICSIMFMNASGDEVREYTIEKIQVKIGNVDMEKYVLGKDGTGKNLDTIMSEEDRMFIDDPETPDVSEMGAISYLFYGMNPDMTKTYIYAKYNNKAYKIVADATTNITESVEVCYEPQGREGTPVAYDSNLDGEPEEWVIITDRNGKVEIVSKDVAKDDQGNTLMLTLGDTDTNVTATTDLNDDDTVDGKDTAILSYNTAITTINNFCKSAVKATNNEGVRSIGGTNNSAIPYTSEKYDAWGSKITVDIASGDTQFEEDFVKMNYFGDERSSTNFWIATRWVTEGNKFIMFNVDSSPICSPNYGMVYLFRVNDDGTVSGSSRTAAVRPVVINPAGI